MLWIRIHLCDFVAETCELHASQAWDSEVESAARLSFLGCLIVSLRHSVQVGFHFERVQVSACKFSHCSHHSNSQCCMMSDGARICCSWSFSVDARSWPVCTVTASNWSLSKSIETQHCFETEHCYEVHIKIGEAKMVLGRQCLRATCVVSISQPLCLHAVWSSLILTDDFMVPAGNGMTGNPVEAQTMIFWAIVVLQLRSVIHCAWKGGLCYLQGSLADRNSADLEINIIRPTYIIIYIYIYYDYIYIYHLHILI